VAAFPQIAYPRISVISFLSRFFVIAVVVTSRRIMMMFQVSTFDLAEKCLTEKYREEFLYRE
jgi:hypothetical protein